MSNELKVFNNEEFGEVRISTINEKEYFCANDIARALGYARPNDAIHAHCRATVKHSIPISGKFQDVNFIPESDVYRLIIKSKLPSSEKFEKWVMDEVLPSIRKHGAYMTPETIEKVLLNPDTIIQLATQLKEEQQKRIEAESKVFELEDKTEILIKENDLISEKVLEWAGRNFVNASVRKYSTSLSGSFGDAWNGFKRELLYKHGINLNSRITNYLNTTGKKTKPKTLDMLHDDEVSKAVSTIVSLCRENNVDISDLIKNLSEDHNDDKN